MKLKFTTEDGTSYLALEFTAKEREILDRRLSALGLVRGKITRPCGMISEEPVWCWKGADRNIFLAHVIDNGRVSFPVHLTDGINDPLIGDGFANIALLRLQLPAGVTTKFKLCDGWINPRNIQNFLAVMTEIMRELFIVEVNTSVFVSFKFGGD